MPIDPVAAVSPIIADRIGNAPFSHAPRQSAVHATAFELLGGEAEAKLDKRPVGSDVTRANSINLLESLIDVGPVTVSFA